MLPSLKTYDQWLANKFGTSPILALLLVLNYEVTGFLVSNGQNEVNGIDIHLTDLTWVGFMAVYICLFHLGYRRLTHRTALHNLAAWVVSAILANASQYFFLTAVSGQIPPTDFVNQLVNGVFTLVGSCLVFTMVLAGVTEGRALMFKLRLAKKELVNLRFQVMEKLESFASQIRRPVSEMVADLESRLTPLITVGGEVQVVTNQLNTFLIKNLKPFIGELSELQPQVRAVSNKLKKVKFSKELRTLAIRDSINIPATASILGLYFVPSSYFLSGLWGAAATFSGISCGAVVWYVIFRIRGQQRFTWLTLAINNGLIVTLSMMVLAIVFNQSFEVATPTAIVSGLLTFSASALQSAIVRRSVLNAELETLNKDLRESNQDLERRMRHLKDQVKSHTHNTLQAQILNLKLQLGGLRYFDEDAQTATLSALEKIKKLGNSKPTAPMNFKQQLAELIEFWNGAVNVSIDVGSGAAALLEADEGMSASVLSVLREAITNAAKYSSDGCLAVALSSTRERTVEFTAKNSFNQTLQEFIPGLGSEILDQSATTWKRSVEGSTFCLEATFVSA